MDSVQEDDEDVLDDACELFTELGFTEVRAFEAPLPAHLLAWMAKDLEGEELTPEQLADEMSYCRIETAEGSFGFFTAAYPALDLTGSGVSVADLFPEDVSPPGVELLTGPAAFEPDAMQRLRTLFAARKSA